MSETDEMKNFEEVEEAKAKAKRGGKRKSKPKVELEAEVQQPQEEPAQEAREAQAAGEPSSAGPDLPPMDVYTLLRSFIGILGANAWQWMGLVKNPMTGNMEKDLDQAKVAIDIIRTLVDQIDNKLDDGERRELRALISDMQINFVQQKSRE